MQRTLFLAHIMRRFRTRQWRPENSAMSERELFEAALELLPRKKPPSAELGGRSERNAKNGWKTGLLSAATTNHGPTRR
jgi:hypothetical protein